MFLGVKDEHIYFSLFLWCYYLDHRDNSLVEKYFQCMNLEENTLPELELTPWRHFKVILLYIIIVNSKSINSWNIYQLQPTLQIIFTLLLACSSFFKDYLERK